MNYLLCPFCDKPFFGPCCEERIKYKNVLEKAFKDAYLCGYSQGRSDGYSEGSENAVKHSWGD